MSPLDIPAWTNSAMDGYAARGDDVRGATAGATRPAPRGRADPGRPFPTRPHRPGRVRPHLHRRAAARGRRHRDPAGGHRSTAREIVTIVKDRDAGVNIRRAGEDIRRGATVLRPGTELGPARSSACSRRSRWRIPLVYRRPRVAILGSGDEIVDVDQPEEILSGRKIASSNTHTLSPWCAAPGGEPVNLGIARDTPESLREHLAPGARRRPAGHHRRDQRGRARLRARRCWRSWARSSGSGSSGCGPARRSGSGCSGDSRGSACPGIR